VVWSDLPGGNVCDILKKLRHNDVGKNPFVPVVVLSDEPPVDLVNGVVESGVDDLLIKPFTSVKFRTRLRNLIEKRRPFIVTSSYIGPDRRIIVEKQDLDAMAQIEVPNTLKASVKGTQTRAQVNLEIKAATSQVNIMRLDSNSGEVGALVQKILAGFAQAGGEKLGEEIEDHIFTLKDVTEDTGRRMKGTPFEAVADICDSLISEIDMLIEKMEKTNKKDLLLLTELSKAFENAFSVEGDNEATKEIRDMFAAKHKSEETAH
jgi:DNA-binding response OmpR family regulator